MRKHRQNWLDVFSGFRIALDARKIILGTVGMDITIIIGLVLMYLAARKNIWPGADMLALDIIRHPFEMLCSAGRQLCYTLMHQPLTSFISALNELTVGRVAMFGGGLALVLFIWSLFGGAIARIAAVDFARGERPQIAEGLAFGARKFGSFFWSPIVPLIFVLIFLLCNYVLGLVGRIPGVGPVFVGVFFVLAVVSGFLSLLMILGTFFGSIFMWPTIAMEGTDSFDAISRGFNYFFARPWKTLWCGFAAFVYGAAVTAFVAAFTFGMLYLAFRTVGAGMGAAFDPIGAAIQYGYSVELSKPNLIAVVLMRVAVIVAWSLVLGFIASYKISAMTIIYSILRRDVDGTDMAEVFTPEPPAGTGAETAAAPAPAVAPPDEQKQPE